MPRQRLLTMNGAFGSTSPVALSIAGVTSTISFIAAPVASARTLSRKAVLASSSEIQMPAALALGDLEGDAPEPSPAPAISVDKINPPDVPIAVEHVIVMLGLGTALAGDVGAAKDEHQSYLYPSHS